MSSTAIQKQIQAIRNPEPINDPLATWERHVDRLVRTGEKSHHTIRVYKGHVRRFKAWWDRK